MALADLLVDSITSKGWLSISNIYFDNSLSINIPASDGYVAYSPSNKTFFTVRPIDTTDTAINERYVTTESKYIGMHLNILAVGEESLQRFNYALYNKYIAFTMPTDPDEQAAWVFPTPNIPSKAQLNALVKTVLPVTDPNYGTENGLYPGTDTIIPRVKAVDDQYRYSVIDMYRNTTATVDIPMGGAVIDTWKTFYIAQAKFLEALKDFGITDAI